MYGMSRAIRLYSTWAPWPKAERVVVVVGVPRTRRLRTEKKRTDELRSHGSSGISSYVLPFGVAWWCGRRRLGGAWIGCVESGAQGRGERPADGGERSSSSAGFGFGGSLLRVRCVLVMLFGPAGACLSRSAPCGSRDRKHGHRQSLGSHFSGDVPGYVYRHGGEERRGRNGNRFSDAHRNRIFEDDVSQERVFFGGVPGSIWAGEARRAHRTWWQTQQRRTSCSGRGPK